MYYNREHRFSPNMEFFIYGSMDTRTSKECNMKMEKMISSSENHDTAVRKIMIQSYVTDTV